MAEILKGAPVAAAIVESIIPRAARLRDRGVAPKLRIFGVGPDESSLAYARAAKKRCEKVGLDFDEVFLPRDASMDEVLAAIRALNEDPAVHGCLLLRPLPKHLDEGAVCEALSPLKDVDCVTNHSLSVVFTGRVQGFAPCTAESVVAILDHYGVSVSGRRAVVIGRSLVIGRPVSMLLQHRNATVTVCHSYTKNLAQVAQEAEILVVAAGCRGLVMAEFLHPGQIVIDVGVNVTENGSLCGDVDFAAAEGVVSALTPVPGGVGSVTTAILCRHVIEAAEREEAFL